MIPFYPLRPRTGGRLDLSRSDKSDWLFQPKINGIRGLVTQDAIWNRHGQILSFMDKLQWPVAALHALFRETPYFDVEILENRGTGHGAMILLDLPGPGTFEERQNKIINYGVPPFTDSTVDQVLRGQVSHPIFHLPLMELEEAQDFWERSKTANEVWLKFYEGLVAKRRGSTYPMQAVNPTKENRNWVKYRW